MTENDKLKQNEQISPLDELKRKALRKKPILWLVFGLIIFGGFALFIQNLATIIDFFKKPHPKLRIVSFTLSSDECIFWEKKSGFFEVPNQIREIINDLYLSQHTGQDPHIALSKLDSALDYLFAEQRLSNIPIRSEELNDIFLNENKPALLKLITPMDPKSPGYSDYNKNRSALFDIVRELIKKEAMEEGNGFIRNYVKPFMPLLMGRFEPIFNLSLCNDGEKTAIINEISIEVKNAVPKKADVPSGLVPMIGIVDVSVLPKPDIYSKELERAIRIAPHTHLDIPVRINPKAQSLHSYELKIIIKGPEVEASTEYFLIEA